MSVLSAPRKGKIDHKLLVMQTRTLFRQILRLIRELHPYPISLTRQGLERTVEEFSQLIHPHAEGSRKYFFGFTRRRVLNFVRGVTHSLYRSYLKLMGLDPPTPKVRLEVMQEALLVMEDILSDLTKSQSKKKCEN